MSVVETAVRQAGPGGCTFIELHGRLNGAPECESLSPLLGQLLSAGRVLSVKHDGGNKYKVCEAAEAKAPEIEVSRDEVVDASNSHDAIESVSVASQTEDHSSQVNSQVDRILAPALVVDRLEFKCAVLGRLANHYGEALGQLMLEVIDDLSRLR